LTRPLEKRELVGIKEGHPQRELVFARVNDAGCVGLCLLLAPKLDIVMNKYSFEVGVRAFVRVQASNPDVTRKVVESVLGEHSSEEIELANKTITG
jgi:hypothetical protein